MLTKQLFLIIVCSLAMTFAHAQRRQYSGVVIDSSTNEVLSGVIVRNTSMANVVSRTNESGEFSIQANVRDMVSFSYLGYQTVNFIAQSIPKRVILRSSAEAIDEVVVIGYGTVDKRDFTGSLAEVDVEDINRAPVPNIAQALAGRVAGLQVSSLSGQPGEESELVIRGGNSITQDNSPLYVVDGFPVEDFSLSSLNPEEIAELTVLKDASATAIYGSRGANGVIIIETKQGKEGLPVITYNVNYSHQKAIKMMEMMDPYEFVKYQLELNPTSSTSRYLTGPGLTLEDYRDSVQGYDWQDMLFRTAVMHNHNLSLRGGTRGTKYAISGNAVNQDGVIINSGFHRYKGSLRLDQDINRKLKVNLNISYSKDKNYGQLTNQAASENSSYATYIMYRTWGYRPVSPTGDLEDDLYDDDEFGTANLLTMNPIISTRNEFREQGRAFFTSNMGINYTLPWNMKLNIRGGYKSVLSRNEYFNNSKTYRGANVPSNLKGVNGGFSEITYADWMNENTLAWNKRFNKNHRLDALIGLSLQGRNTDRYSFEAVQIPNEDLGMRGLGMGYPRNPISTASANTLLSYLSRVNYNYRGKYLLTATFRADGSSKFAPQNRWGYFPSFAAAWRIGQEKFMKDIPVVSDSKLRVSWGATGNNRVGDFAISNAMNFYGFYGIGTGSAVPDYAVTVSSFGNEDLRWETTYQLDIGYELSLFRNRLNFVFDYYNKDTKDLLLNANVPRSTGFARIYRNVGSIRNTGFELTANSVNIDRKNFKWQSSFNISFNRNKVLALTDDEKTFFSNVSAMANWNTANLYVTQVGMPVSSFFGFVWDGVYQLSDFDQLPDGSYLLKDGIVSLYENRSTTQPGDIKYRDINGDMIVDDKDKIVMGRTLPKHYGGFNNNFKYKDISLNVFFQWNYGNDIMNANRLMFEGNAANRLGLNQFATYMNRWTEDNPSNEYFRTRGHGPLGYYSSKYLEDGSFLRLKTVELAYRLPRRWVRKISSIDLSVAAQNLYTWSNYSGLDPEVSTQNSILTPGFDYSAYAQNLTVSFGAKVIF